MTRLPREADSEAEGAEAEEEGAAEEAVEGADMDFSNRAADNRIKHAPFA